MATAPTGRPGLQWTLILGLLLVATACAWALLGWQRAAGGMAMNSPSMGLRAPLFLAIWVVMMVARMFPAAAVLVVPQALPTFPAAGGMAMTVPGGR